MEPTVEVPLEVVEEEPYNLALAEVRVPGLYGPGLGSASGVSHVLPLFG